MDVQADETRLETVLQEYPFLLFSPCDVSLQNLYLDVSAVRYGSEEVEQRPNYTQDLSERTYTVLGGVLTELCGLGLCR